MNTVVHVHVLVMIDVMIVMISLELEVIVPNSLGPSWTLDAVFGKIQNFPLVDHMALAGNTMHGNILGSFFPFQDACETRRPFHNAATLRIYHCKRFAYHTLSGT